MDPYRVKRVSRVFILGYDRCRRVGRGRLQPLGQLNADGEGAWIDLPLCPLE